MLFSGSLLSSTRAHRRTPSTLSSHTQSPVRKTPGFIAIEDRQRRLCVCVSAYASPAGSSASNKGTASRACSHSAPTRSTGAGRRWSQGAPRASAAPCGSAQCPSLACTYDRGMCMDNLDPRSAANCGFCYVYIFPGAGTAPAPRRTSNISK